MVEPLKKEFNSEITWRPYLLRPGMPAEGMQVTPQRRARYQGMRERLRERAHEAGLPITFREEWIPNSRRALEASEYARAQGHHEDFHRVVFRRYFGEGEDISDWRVLRAAAEEVGLDSGAMERQTKAGEYEERVLSSYQEALRLGISGIPTYVLAGRFAIVGAQPLQAFREVIAEKNLASKGGSG